MIALHFQHPLLYLTADKKSAMQCNSWLIALTYLGCVTVAKTREDAWYTELAATFLSLCSLLERLAVIVGCHTRLVY